MRIGIIGAGNIGGTIGAHWARAGHEVRFAVRHPDAIAELVASLKGSASTGSAAEAASFGPVLLFAAPYGLWPAFAQDHGAALVGKTIIDAANPYPERDGDVARRAIAEGAGRHTQSLVPGALVVKAFNTIFWKDLRDEAGRAPPRLAIPLVGDDEAALDIARGLITDAGFDSVDVGGLDRSRDVDPGATIYAQSFDADTLRHALRRERD